MIMVEKGESGGGTRNQQEEKPYSGNRATSRWSDDPRGGGGVVRSRGGRQREGLSSVLEDGRRLGGVNNIT